MIAWKSLQLLLLCALLAAWSNAQAQEAKPNGSQLPPVYSPANPKGGWKGKGIYSTYATRAPFHAEGGKGNTSKLVKFQVRPDPLSK